MENKTEEALSTLLFLIKNIKNRHVTIVFLNKLNKIFGGSFSALFVSDSIRQKLVNIEQTNYKNSPEKELSISFNKKDNPLINNVISGIPSTIDLFFFNQSVGYELANFDKSEKIYLWSAKESYTNKYYLLVYQASETDLNNLCLLNKQLGFFQHCITILGLYDDLKSCKTQLSYLDKTVKNQLKTTQKSQTQVQDLLKNLIIGGSSKIYQIRKTLTSFSASSMNIMIRGETGTGKDLIAQAIDKISSNSQKIIVQNCAAIPDNLLEAEIFGYKKGAFSGADRDKKGLIAQANGSILFLDEIADMPIKLQAKLLRVIQEKCYRPLGSDKEYKSNFRLITATHQNIEHLIKKGKFRQDLFYRLQQLVITLPPLRERKSDINNLSHYFLTKYNQDEGRHIISITSNALALLKEYDFPGNIRELKTLIYRACMQASSKNHISKEDIYHAMNMSSSLNSPPSFADTTSTTKNKITLGYRQECENFEKHLLHQTLETFKGNKTAAAKELKLPLRTFTWKCKKLGILL